MTPEEAMDLAAEVAHPDFLERYGEMKQQLAAALTELARLKGISDEK